MPIQSIGMENRLLPNRKVRGIFMTIKTLIDDVSLEFVIAAKSFRSFESIIEVYKGHYGDYDERTSLNALVEILSPIVEALKDVRLSKVLSDLLPNNRWKSGQAVLDVELPLNEVTVRYLISELRMIPRDRLFVDTDESKDLSIKDLVVKYVIPRMTVLTETHLSEPNNEPAETI